MRSRIDWKYALSLELTDKGFDFSVLSEFRSRLVAGGQEAQLLNLLLQVFQAKGWLKSGGKQRTDSTHVQRSNSSAASERMCRRNAPPCVERAGNRRTGMVVFCCQPGLV